MFLWRRTIALWSLRLGPFLTPVGFCVWIKCRVMSARWLRSCPFSSQLLTCRKCIRYVRKLFIAWIPHLAFSNWFTFICIWGNECSHPCWARYSLIVRWKVFPRNDLTICLKVCFSTHFFIRNVFAEILRVGSTIEALVWFSFVFKKD
jgi:hypothetical protein